MISLLWLLGPVIYTALMITVLLVDDNATFQRILCSLLEQDENIKVVATATNGVDAVAQAISYWPDVAVVDVVMPYLDGIQAASQIRDRSPATRVVMLSILDQPQYVERALEAGASGYVLKDTAALDLMTAIRALSKGNYYFSDQIAGVANKYIHRNGNDSWAA